MKHLFLALGLLAGLAGTAALADACGRGRHTGAAPCESIPSIGSGCCSAGTIISERIISVRILSDRALFSDPIVISEPPILHQPVTAPTKVTPKKMPYAN